MENVLIIGSRSIVGQEIASVFQSSQANVILSHSIETDASVSKAAKALHLDLRENNSINSFVKQLDKLMLKIDIAIFLSGILPGQNLQTYQFDEIDEVMSINFNGQAKLISKLLPNLPKNHVCFCFRQFRLNEEVLILFTLVLKVLCYLLLNLFQRPCHQKSSKCNCARADSR